MRTTTNDPGPALILNTWWTVHSFSTQQWDWWGGKEWFTVKCPLLQCDQYSSLCNSNDRKSGVSIELYYLRRKCQLFLRVWLNFNFAPAWKGTLSIIWIWLTVPVGCFLLTSVGSLRYFTGAKIDQSPPRTQTQRSSQIRNTVGAVTIYWSPAAFQVCMCCGALEKSECMPKAPQSSESSVHPPSSP